jgi:hypothetical protein
LPEILHILFVLFRFEERLPFHALFSSPDLHYIILLLFSDLETWVWQFQLTVQMPVFTYNILDSQQVLLLCDLKSEFFNLLLQVLSLCECMINLNLITVFNMSL